MANQHSIGISRAARVLLGCLAAAVVIAQPSRAVAQAVSPKGHISQFRITEPTRLDWIFALANQSPAEEPVGLLKDYDSTKQRFELYVPRRYDKQKPSSLILFISPGQKGTGLAQFRALCDRKGVLFASPYQAGNQTPGPRRIRIVMDTLDEVRRRYNVDPDRTYIGGFSGGGRIAFTIATALPEYFGGILPVCAGGQLRQESWLRQRVIDRLRIAMLTGETDFNRGEIERMTQTQLSGVGATSRVWTVARIGHGIPSGNTLTEAYDWLEEGLKDRQALAKRFPASRISDAPSRSEWAGQLLAEARSRLKTDESPYAGLMQLKGLHTRWNDLPGAQQALKTLQEYDSAADRPWEAEDIAEQRRFLIAQARGVDAYATGPLPKQYEKQKASMINAAIRLWSSVVQDGQDEAAVAEANRRLPILKAVAMSNLEK
jgi:poly(3-hydroxybutyrate) depolymerase